MLKFESLPDGRVLITEPFTEDVWKGKGITDSVRVKAGFISDGASIPRWMWPIIGPPIRSEHFLPAIVHDWLCVHASSYDERLMGDAKFFALLRKYGVPRWKRTLMYMAVRAYGRYVWLWKRRGAK